MTTLTPIEISDFRKASYSKDLARAKARVDQIEEEARALPDSERTPANIANLYRNELDKVETLIRDQKRRSTKSSRSISYEVCKKIKKGLKIHIAYWEGEQNPEPQVEAIELQPLEVTSDAPKLKLQRAKPAALRGLTLEAVRTVFDKAGLGPTSQSGEWAAALIALVASECLVGNPYAIERWFIAAGFAGITSRKTIDDRKQLTEPEQFFTSSESNIFTSVRRHLKQLKA
jgi:hypothetical protein